MTNGKDGYLSLKDPEFVLEPESGVMLSTLVYNHFLKKKVMNAWQAVKTDKQTTLSKVMSNWRNFSKKTVNNMKQRKKCKDFLAIINAQTDGRIREEDGKLEKPQF